MRRPELGTRGLALSPKHHPGMIKNAVDEVAVSGKAGIVDIVDMISSHRVTTLVSALASATSLVVTTVGKPSIALTHRPGLQPAS